MMQGVGLDFAPLVGPPDRTGGGQHEAARSAGADPPRARWSWSTGSTPSRSRTPPAGPRGPAPPGGAPGAAGGPCCWTSLHPRSGRRAGDRPGQRLAQPGRAAGHLGRHPGPSRADAFTRTVRGPSGVQRAPDRPGHRPGGGPAPILTSSAPASPTPGACGAFRRRSGPSTASSSATAEEKEAVTGIAAEPWHFRYVGGAPRPADGGARALSGGVRPLPGGVPPALPAGQRQDRPGVPTPLPQRRPGTGAAGGVLAALRRQLRRVHPHRAGRESHERPPGCPCAGPLPPAGGVPGGVPTTPPLWPDWPRRPTSGSPGCWPGWRSLFSSWSAGTFSPGTAGGARADF